MKMELENLSETDLRWQEPSKREDDEETSTEARALGEKVWDMMRINRGMVLVKVVYSLINLGAYVMI